jgi:hypothetical protein
MKGNAFSPPTVTTLVRVPPLAAVAPMVTSSTAPGQLSFTNSIGIILTPMLYSSLKDKNAFARLSAQKYNLFERM